MKERKSYKGTLNGNFCVCTDKKPKGFKVEEEITFYQADEGKVFVNEKGEQFDIVMSLDGFQEIDKPTEEKAE